MDKGNSRNRLAPFCLLFFWLIAWHPCAYATNLITDYQRTFIPGFTPDNRLQIAIRMFYRNNEPYLLIVDPQTFLTRTLHAGNFSPHKRLTTSGAKPITLREIQETPYIQALAKYTSPPYPLENYGLTHAETATQGFFLTVDLCPSIKPLEDKLFKPLVALAAKVHKPIPLGVAVSGMWIIAHPQEYAWLLQQETKHRLQITWINHSFSHVVYADLPHRYNFLLASQTNIEHEILATEKLLLEKGQLPSVFFRPPGLTANESIILKLRRFGLIPLGSDAWFSHGQHPKPGGIILIHGNAAELEEIKAILPLLQSSSWHFLPLTQLFTTNLPLT